MTATLSHQITLTEDELQGLALRLGIREFPTVLAVRPCHTFVDPGDAAAERANRDLLSRNLIVEGDVHEELVPVLRALQRPEREFAMRLVTPEGTARITVVQRESLAVLARRIGDDISVRILGHGIDVRDMSSALLIELPQARQADIEDVGAPLPELSECLSGTHDSIVLADRIRALGADSRAAMLLGTALASRQAFAEVVYYALRDDEGRISRSPAAVGVFYTKRGRIVGVPSASPSGQLWATVKAGSDHAVVDAIGRLVELCDEGWGAYRAD
jgi:EspG family